MSRRVLVGMSGGVDSAVAAFLLVRRGFRVAGVFMRTGGDGPSDGCYGSDEEDLRDARETASAIGIPFLAVGVADAYRRRVLRYFAAEYAAGRTPNPCMMCNRFVKFSALWRRAAEAGAGFDLFATGHYARVEPGRDGRPVLRRARHEEKDQSYFLAFLPRARLARVILPLGDLSKDEVRRIAADAGLPVHDKGESQDFAAGDRLRLRSADERPGPILDTGGRVIGRHRGISRYTVGQRRGLGVAAGRPLYVVGILPAENAVVAGGADECRSAGLSARPVAIHDRRRLGLPGLAAQIRSTHRPAAANVSLGTDGLLRVRFERPQWAAAPGQAVVAYDGDTVVAAGVVEASEPARADGRVGANPPLPDPHPI